MYALKSICTYNLREEVLSVVVHDGHMVGVPTYRAAHMEHELRNELKHCRHLVSRDLGRMIVTCIDGEHHVVLGCICSVEIV